MLLSKVHFKVDKFELIGAFLQNDGRLQLSEGNHAVFSAFYLFIVCCILLLPQSRSVSEIKLAGANSQ